jgi:peptidoglycan/LPS O-acetylase OafA/YrhL
MAAAGDICDCDFPWRGRFDARQGNIVLCVPRLLMVEGTERVAALDLLRGMAALCVAIPHFFMLNSAVFPADIVSVLAVEVFFVLSGFVLGPQILRCLRCGRVNVLGVFLTRRWMRTIPPYLFALALISVIAGNVNLADLARYAFYVENLFAPHNVSDYFPVAWSLSIEEWFYICFPSLLMIAARCVRDTGDRFAVLATLCFIAAVTLLRLLFGNLDDWGPSVRRVVVFRLDSIAYGFLLFMLMRRSKGSLSDWRAAFSNLPAVAVVFTVAALFAGLLTWRIEAVQNHLAETLFPFAAAGFGMSAIILFYSARNIIQRRRRLAECCYFLGRVSYSLYLFHLSVAMIIAPLVAGFSLVVQLSTYLGICFALSAAFYAIVERPILAVRPGYPQSDEFSAELVPLAGRTGSAA